MLGFLSRRCHPSGVTLAARGIAVPDASWSMFALVCSPVCLHKLGPFCITSRPIPSCIPLFPHFVSCVALTHR